jgi:cytosine/adenosine deaminase-related metal-dependent hydrolase
VDLVLHDVSAWLGEVDGVVHGVSVRVVGNRIVEVARRALAGGDRVDLQGRLLLPGLISGHTHVAGGSSTRGLIETGRSYARPLEIVERDFDDEELDALTAYNLAELIRSGCTAQVEMSLSLRQARSYARVAKRLGARGWVGGMVPGIGRLFPIWFGSDDDLRAAEADTLREIEANLAHGRSLGQDGLVRGMMTPHAADTHTPATRSAIAAAAKELGTGVHTHLSQGSRETATVRRRFNRTPTQWWADAGVFDAPFFAAHFTAPDWVTDPPILRRAGAVYATCPSAGGPGGATQPYPEALAAGIAVNIGIDTHSNDMVENLKLAVLYGQARASLLEARAGADEQRALRAPTAVDAVRGCTTTAADALRRPDLGRIEVGATADLVAVNVSGFLTGSGAPPPEPLNNLLYTSGSAVELVLVDGRVMVQDGVFAAADVRQIVEGGGRVARRLWAALEREGWFG